MADLTKEQEEKISQLQQMEQSIQSFMMQKQNIQSQLSEIESALKELENTSTAYKIVGNIMVRSKQDDLKKDLEQKREIMGLKIKNLEKQEESVKSKAEKTQSEVLKGMKE